MLWLAAYALSYIPYSVTKYGVVAISEALREELSPRGIGVSVLCPGPIKTRIMDWYETCLNATIPPSPIHGPKARYGNGLQGLRERVSQGIDPFYVGELVREGIEDDWPYIFVDPNDEPRVEKRFSAIKHGFDRVPQP